MSALHDAAFNEAVDVVVRGFGEIGCAIIAMRQCLWNADTDATGYARLWEGYQETKATLIDGALQGFMATYPDLDETGIRVIRRIASGVKPSGAERAVLAQSLRALL